MVRASQKGHFLTVTSGALFTANRAAWLPTSKALGHLPARDTVAKNIRNHRTPCEGRLPGALWESSDPHSLSTPAPPPPRLRASGKARRAIDAHLHLSEREDDLLNRYAESNGLGYTLKDLLGEMKAHSVEKGLLLSPPMKSGGPRPNEDVLALCGRSGGVLSPILTVEPTRKDVEAALRLADEERSAVKGFKVRLGYVAADADSPLFGPLYDYAQAEGLPVLFHTGDTATSDGDLSRARPMVLDRLANAREELTVVLCHFGNPWIEEAAEVVYKHPRAYADISGLTTGGGAYAEKYAALLARKLSEAVYFLGGGEKILFGTDYPVTGYEDALGVVELMDLDEADRERVLWRNAKELFGV